GILVRRAAVLPFGEPQLLGAVAHHPLVEHAIVVDQALPRAAGRRMPVAGDPVDHVAAVAGPQSAGIGAVQERVLLLRRGPALLQVLPRAIAPMLADRVGECLAVAGGAVEVDHHHRVALARIGLRVPAIAPAVAEAALRAAVDQEGHRIALAFLVVPRLDHVAVHRLVVPAAEGELLVLAEGHVRQHLRRARRDRALRRAADAAGDDLVAALHRGAGEHIARPGDGEAADAAVA